MNCLPYGGSTYSKTAVADPIFDRRVTHGDGWRIFDDQGNDYADLIMGLSSIILGHRHIVVDEAIRRQLSCGTTLSLATDVEFQAAERLLKHFPDGCMVQWATNGSDATTGAIRLARAVAGRPMIVMANDGYHGFHDWCLGGSSRGFGIPEQWDGENICLVDRITDLNDLTSVTPPHSIAAVIIEPDLYPHWLKDLRAWTSSHGALLIFDEVMTFGRFPGFLASAHYGVSPDCWSLGKALANGMPVSAIVGDKSILSRFGPGPDPNVFFSSTWAAHPLSMAAVIATLDVLEREDGPAKLYSRSVDLHRALEDKLALSDAVSLGFPPWNRITGPPRVMRAWRQLMLEHGVLIYGAHNLSLAHDANAIHRVKEAWENSLRLLPERLADIPESSVQENSIMRR